MALLEVKSLVKTFKIGTKTLRAVDSVNLSISKGETLGLVGESGCGKTTLSRCILGLERANSGSIEFDGIDVQHASAKVLKNLRRDMQIVFQDPFTSLDPRWSVRRIIEEPLQVHNIVPKSQRNAEIVRLLETVGLPSTVMTRYPHEFSGGQRQRIGIARALASRPRFLIADEPVSALDISIRAHILNLLRDIQRERSLSILFIAHDLAAVKQVSNRIAVMYKGVIMEEGPADNLFTDTRHPYTRGLIDSIPMIKPIKQDLDARPANQQSLTANSKASDCCVYTDKCKYVQDLCLNSRPDLVEISQTHKARCHYANQLRLGLFASIGEIADVELSEAVVYKS